MYDFFSVASEYWPLYFFDMILVEVISIVFTCNHKSIVIILSSDSAVVVDPICNWFLYDFELSTL